MITWFTQEQKAFQETLSRRIIPEKIAPRSDEIEERDQIPADVLDFIREYGILSILVPEEYGGQGGDLTTLCIAVEEFSKASGALGGLTYAGALGALVLSTGGTEEQKKRFFPKLSKGKVVALVLTEPDCGTDLAAIRTKAVSSGDEYLISGTKIFISNGNVADMFILLAKTNPNDGSRGASIFLFEKGLPGFSIGKLEKKMGLHGLPMAELIFDEMPVPSENRIGEEGAGFKIMMRLLDKSRVIIGAWALGVAQGALEYAINYAKQRTAFGRSIGQFQTVQLLVADMAARTEATRALVYRVAAMLDEGATNIPQYTSMVKYFASDSAMAVTSSAIQVLGGHGYIADHPLERMMRDAKALQLLEGVNQVQRLVVGGALLGMKSY